MNPVMSRITVAVVSLACLSMLGGCQNRLKQERDALWEQNQELQGDLERRNAEMQNIQSQLAGYAADVNRLQGELDASRSGLEPTIGANTGFSSIPGIETQVGFGTITVRVPGDVLFASGQAVLKSTSKQTLDQIASVIRSDYPNKTVRIEGYTDTDPIRKSKWTDNLDLSLQRAAAVHRYLKQQGIDPEQMYAAGFGEHHPAESKARSRRVEIVVVMNE